MGNENNCFTPWPDMGQAMRVYSENGPSPTIANHHVIVLHLVSTEHDSVIPIQDGREMEKKQNGFGIGEPGDPMYTLDTTGAQSVAYDSAKVMRRIPPEEGDDIVEAIVVSDLMKGQTNNQSIGSGLLQVYMESE